MTDLGKILKQAQQMQQKMAKAQEELANETVDAEAGGGMVKVTLNGRQELLSIQIDPKVIDPEESDFLEDLIVAAFNEGQKKVSALMQERMGDVTGGMQLPGMF